MRRTYNQFQETYMLAKAHLKTLEAHEKEIDHQYIIDNGIKNPDGSIPEYIYCIDDEPVFHKANIECSSIVIKSGLWSEILEARELLKSAEEELLKYALSVIPHMNAHEKEVLERAVVDNCTTRMKVIELVLKLDTTTVKA